MPSNNSPFINITHFSLTFTGTTGGSTPCTCADDFRHCVAQLVETQLEAQVIRRSEASWLLSYHYYMSHSAAGWHCIIERFYWTGETCQTCVKVGSYRYRQFELERIACLYSVDRLDLHACLACFNTLAALPSLTSSKIYP